MAAIQPAAIVGERGERGGKMGKRIRQTLYRWLRRENFQLSAHFWTLSPVRFWRDYRENKALKSLLVNRIIGSNLQSNDSTAIGHDDRTHSRTLADGDTPTQSKTGHCRRRGACAVGLLTLHAPSTEMIRLVLSNISHGRIA